MAIQSRPTEDLSALRQELMCGQTALTSWLRSLTAAVALPQSIDDIERDFQTSIYTRMLNNYAVSSAVDKLKTGTLSEGVRFVNRCKMPSPFKPDPKEQARYQKAEEIREFVERGCDNLQQSIEDILNEMLDFLPYGHKLAEKVYAPDSDGLLTLSTLRVKPRAAYVFAVTGVNDVLGVVPAKPGIGSMLILGQQEVPPSDILDRSKLWILTHKSQGGDPRGQSCLRPAYDPWYLFQQFRPAFLKNGIQFGTPSLKMGMPENVGMMDAVGDGANATTQGEIYLEKGKAFQNGSVIALPFGATLDVVEATGDGAFFLNAFNELTREIKEAIFIAARATTEAQHGSKADSETATDVVGEVVQGIRRRVEMSFYRDVIQPWVALNWGPEVARELSPYLSLSETETGDIAGKGQMYAALKTAGLLHPSQYQGMDEDLKLPPRDYEAQQAELDSVDATNAELLKRGESASLETRILMLHPDWTPAQVEAEKQLILDESGASVPDPTTLLSGLSSPLPSPDMPMEGPQGTPDEAGGGE